MQRSKDFSLTEKVNKILKVFLLLFFLFLFRIWVFTALQGEALSKEALKPTHKVTFIPAKRGTIRDRFNEPLAINKIAYRASVLYSQIRQVPQVSWEKDENGSKQKVYKRRNYIKKLAHLLSKTLSLDCERVEEEIISKSALFFHLPYTIKDCLTEKEYYRLKTFEQSFPGLKVEAYPARFYPNGKLACDLLGYLGPISKELIESLHKEIEQLELYIQGDEEALLSFDLSLDQAKERLEELKASAYTMRDQVGKMGVEGMYEEKLRGRYGRYRYRSDSRGNALSEPLVSDEALPGSRLLLTISRELQEYAEELLIRFEDTGKMRVSKGVGGAKEVTYKKEGPLVKGGAIVAIDPVTFEVLCLASHPRFDPNDFVEGRRKDPLATLKWFENEAYIEALWGGQAILQKEIFDLKKGGYATVSIPLSWPYFLESIAEPSSCVRKKAKNMTLKEAVISQNSVERLLELSSQGSFHHLMEALDFERQLEYNPKNREVCEVILENLELRGEKVESLKQEVLTHLKGLQHLTDKALYVDLARLLCRGDKFTKELLLQFGDLSAEEYFTHTKAFLELEPLIKEALRKQFSKRDFSKWLALNKEAFIKEKRKEEQERKTWARPYLDYLDEEEKKAFEEFYQTYRLDFVLAFLFAEITNEEVIDYQQELFLLQKDLANGFLGNLSAKKSFETLHSALSGFDLRLVKHYLATMRSFQELNRPLYGSYPALRRDGSSIPLEKHLAMAFYPKYGYGYGRSFAYRQACTQGSLFKIVTAYEALRQRYRGFKERGKEVVCFEEMNPLTITDFVKKVDSSYVFGQKDGQFITPMYKGGRIPRSVSKNIGKVDIFKAFEHSSNPYFALLAAESIDSPERLLKAAKHFSFGSKTGIDLPYEYKGALASDLEENKTGLYSFAIGQHGVLCTPLQTAVLLASIANKGYVMRPKVVKTIITEKSDSIHIDQAKTEVVRKIELPDVVRDMLLSMMDSVIEKIYENQLFALKLLYQNDERAMKAIYEMEGKIGGKTSTSELVERSTIDPREERVVYNHTWFGGIVYRREDNLKHTVIMKDKWGKPELVVVVYARFGSFGKDLLPIAAQIAAKWREIKARRDPSSI